MIMSDLKADWEKAIVFTYIAECGIPPAKDGEDAGDVQARTLALLCVLRTETSVTMAGDPPKGGEPKAFCTFPLFKKHDPKRWYPCWKPAVIVDALFPVEWEGNRCKEHLNFQQPVEFEI